jgi:Asp-tRNA(Asn)/Glu-tRNA(Gln) amidotransferase A subunit family amidase
VRDAAVLLEVLAGYDPGDPITASTIGNVPLSYGAGVNADGLKGARLGVIREPIGQNIDTEAADHLQIRAAIRRALDEMSDRGAEIVDAIPAGRILELLHRPFGGGETEAAVDRYLSSHANAPVHSLREIVLSADHLVLPSQRAQLAESLGKSTSDPGYLQNLLNREAVRQEVLKVMADHALDALVFATMERSPPAIPADLLTSSATVRSLGSNGALSPATGFPQLTVPCGVTDDGLPVGLSLLGRPFSEESLLRMAYAYEQARPHRAPPKAAPTLPGEP